MKREFVLEEVVIAGARVEGAVEALVCQSCDESFVLADELRDFEQKAAEALLRAGWHHGDVIAFARKSLGMSGTSFAKFCDVALETVSRWEHDRQKAPKSVYLALTALLSDRIASRESTVEEAANAKTRKRPPRLSLAA